jgi:hypothetical protein
MIFRPIAASAFFFAVLAGCTGFRDASPAVVEAGAPDAAAPSLGADGGAPAADGASPDSASPSLPPIGDGDAGTGADACVSNCAGRTCGADPVCGASCGVCQSTEACATSASGARCSAPTIVWEVDGVVVAQMATFEAFYTPSQGTYSIEFPHWGRSVQAWTPANPTPGTQVSCPDGGPGSLGLITSDNSYAGLDALPARWKNLTFVSCGVQSSGDVVTARDLIVTSVSPARIAGSYDIMVTGEGPRAGSSLHVHGVFDVAPQTQ